MKVNSPEKEPPLVSVIIPAYNVEKFINTCVSSVLNQDYEKIEVVVVDDGATDETGSILDIIAASDQRVNVIHKDNSGVSAARNTGLDNANGKYVIFVDADDYISYDCISYLVGLIQSADGDFAFSRKCFTTRNEEQTDDCTMEMVAPSDALAILISPDMIVGCWNKIYDKKFLDDNEIRFSTSLYYGEGLNFITTVAQRARRVGVGNRKVYYYRRDNSQSATAVFNIDKIYNGEKALQTIEENLLIHDTKIDTMLLLHRCTFNAGAITKLIENKKKNEYYEDYERWLRFIRTNWIRLAVNRNISLYRKGLLLCGCISPELLTLLSVKRRKRIVNESVKE